MLTVILLQADTTNLVETGLQINPYGLTVYGALVVVLGFVAYRLYKDLHRERDASRDLADKAMVLMTQLEERLPSVREMAEINHILQQISKDIEEIKKRE